MTIQEEIAYREELLEREKISDEERMWLRTHSIYHRLLGAPYLNRSIEHIVPNQKYLLRVTMQDKTYYDRMVPVIAVPAGKGGIKVCDDSVLVDINNKRVSPKNIRGLVIELENAGSYSDEIYQSEMGLLTVEYQCDYFDSKTNLHMRQYSSNTAMLAMKRECLDEHTIRYYCKAPMEDSFDAMIFTVEMTELSK